MLWAEFLAAPTVHAFFGSTLGGNLFLVFVLDSNVTASHIVLVVQLEDLGYSDPFGAGHAVLAVGASDEAELTVLLLNLLY